MKTIAIGRIVHYVLTAQDAAEINRRRTNADSIRERIGKDKWPLGAQAHIGSMAEEGDVFPMIVTVVWSDHYVNGQVFLDGNDQLWKTSVPEGDQKGNWHWPEIN
jgi:hypothetical protein